MKNEIDRDLEKIYKKITEKKEGVIIVTKHVTAVGGNETTIMNMLTELIERLKNNGMSETLIKGAVKNGLMSEKETKELTDELLNADSFEDAMNKIADFLGEEKRW